MLKHPLKTLAITAALTASMIVSASAASIGGAEVRTENLNLRSAPSAASPVITQVPNGTQVVVGDKVSDEWYKVVYRGATGYMSTQYLSFGVEMDGNFGFGSVRGSDVKLRLSPSFSSAVIADAQQNARLDIIGVSGQWYKVNCNGLAGYIHSDYIALNGGVPDDFTNSAEKGQKIVDMAMKYMGVPYVWGGTSPRGFDCSGLVYYVYKECGYTINRTAASIYDNGTYVEKEKLQVGDAICFSSYSSSIGHVGIYIGDGQFIHASSGSGRVIISGLDENYYSRRYVGARRIV